MTKNNNIKHYLYRILDKTTKTGAPLVEIQGRGSCLRLHGIISDLINFLADRQHLLIELADHRGTLLQFLIDNGSLFLTSLITELVVEVCPVIHCSRPELKLQFDPLILILEWNCDLQDQMQALIAGFLGLLDIVLDLDDADVLLFLDQVSHLVDIVHISAHSTDPDQVVDLLHCLREIHIEAFFLHFLADTVVALESSGLHLYVVSSGLSAEKG